MAGSDPDLDGSVPGPFQADHRSGAYEGSDHHLGPLEDARHCDQSTRRERVTPKTSETGIRRRSNGILILAGEPSARKRWRRFRARRWETGGTDLLAR